MKAEQAAVTRHYTASAWWESVYREPHPRIRPYIDGLYQGWVEYSSAPVRRRETPGAMIPVILNLGALFRLLDPSDPGGSSAIGSSFVAGLHTSYALVESFGVSTAIQVNLTPMGAILLFGMPLESLTNRVIALEDILGVAGRRLMEQLHDAACWDARFDIIDTFIAGRIEVARRPSTSVGQVWHRLMETDGRITVRELANELSYSRKHLTAQFHAEMGLPPKMMARILRFNGAIRTLQQDTAVRLADLAQDCGYYDQSHFVRDFVAFAGVPPVEFLRRRTPDGGVIDP